jgi:putative Holliday junction resolvase
MPATPEGGEASPSGGLLLAFDFGMKRLGVATANLATRTASPLTTLAADQGLPWAQIDRLVEDWRPQRFVVGLPEGDGAATIAARVRKFVAELEARYGLPVSTVDETLTSEAARAEIATGRRSGFLRRRVTKGRTDRIAACLIAEQWLNEH